MTIEETIKIFSNYALVGTLEETGVDVAFDATPDQMRAAIEVVRSALRAQQEAEPEKMSGNIAEAVQDVQDMIDVLDVGGSAYVYRHNGGRERLWNILSCLEAKTKKCRNVGIGSYDCYVQVPKYDISCDKCLATEIRMLNDMGIKTVGCCCGHQKTPGYIQVAPEYVEKMKSAGYQPLPEDENGNGKWCFTPKSVLLVSDQQDLEKDEPPTLEDLKQLGTVEIARRAAIEELISPAALSPSSGNVMERCFGMDKMLYKLYKCVDGAWFIWGTYSDPLRLACAANELGRMGLEIKVEAVGTRDLSEAGEC